jgi:hypothetical protein
VFGAPRLDLLDVRVVFHSGHGGQPGHGGQDEQQ